MNKFHKVSESTFLKSSDSTAYEKVVVPQRSTKSSAGYDITTPIRILINPGSKKLVPTGIKVELDSDKVLMIVPRSSIGIKKDLSLSNTVAVIDADYYNNPDNEGHIFISLRNVGEYPIGIEAGERIAQGIIMQYFTTDDDNASDDRSGGIGSTGK